MDFKCWIIFPFLFCFFMDLQGEYDEKKGHKKKHHDEEGHHHHAEEVCVNYAKLIIDRLNPFAIQQIYFGSLNNVHCN